METAIISRIVLENPPPGIDFGLQKGSGNNYEIIQTQRSGTDDMYFEFSIKIKDKGGVPDFFGPFVQGPVGERFVYINIGTLAGQKNSGWTRRLKIPLRDITMDMINRLIENSKLLLETHVPGTGKDGSPNCATVKPFAGWAVKECPI
ncbi:MAG: DUF5990 family protein [Mucilaginibacter sp.]